MMSRADQAIKMQLQPKKPRLVFTDIQRRTLMAIFNETRRPNREMQSTIADQLGLKLSTVANFFMNARRRSQDKYADELSTSNDSNHSNRAAAGDMTMFSMQHN